MQFGKKKKNRLEKSMETSFETQTLNCGEGRRKPGNCDSKMELKVIQGKKPDTSFQRNEKGLSETKCT